jgi:CheY-like chemotaxis protein
MDVLIVDDDADIARSERPRVAVLDGSMPGLSGSEVCRRLRAAPETEDILRRDTGVTAERAGSQPG